MSDSVSFDTSIIEEDEKLRIFRCSCGKEFNVTGYPVGYKFACPQCHSFCEIQEDPDELESGTILGDFEVIKKIGRGGMGVVYLGRQISLERPVAIKVLKQEIAQNDEFVHRFTIEAKTAAQIIHNNIVQIYFVGNEKNTFFIAMEFVDGKSLREMIHDGECIPEQDAIGILFQASLGLQRAHKQNILHRDIKPDNLIMNKQGDVKVADFGLALELNELKKKEGITKLEGSPHYMSPEQAMKGEINFSSDIYSLGATLYHMVTSLPPFTGNSPAAIIAKHVTDYPRSPKEIKSNLSKGLCQLIQKMMAKRPDERFSSMEELIDFLHELKEAPRKTSGLGKMHWFMEERNDASRLEDMMAVLEINKVIGQEKDLDKLLLRIIHEITLAMKAERSTLYIYDSAEKEIWAKVAEGLEGHKIIRLSLGVGIAGSVAENLQTEVINNPYDDPRFNREIDEKTGFVTRNTICMPVLGSEVELLGVIQVLNKKKGDFDYYDESILSALAFHVGMMLEKNRYYCMDRPGCKEACDNYDGLQREDHTG